jgi:hypothetical protein
VHGLNYNGTDGSAYTADTDCSNPGGLGDPAFVLKGGPDGKDAVHAHPDDKTDDQKVDVQYSTASDCTDMSAYSPTLPAGGVAKCVKVTGFAIKRAGDGPHGLKKSHGTTIELKLKFRPVDTDWAGNPTLYFHAGFNFRVTKLITYGAGTPGAQTFSSVDNVSVVGVGKRVTAIGGFVFQNRTQSNPGDPATGEIARLFNSAADAGVTNTAPFGSCSTGTPVAAGRADDQGFYFIWKAEGSYTGAQDDGLKEASTTEATDLPSGVQYYVQVCDGTNVIVGRLLAGKLGDKVFDEEDFTDITPPRPTSLVIAHHDGKPSNNDTVVITFPEPLMESSMCTPWGTDVTKDQTLSGMTVTIENNTGDTGNDRLVLDTASVGTACGGSSHFGSIDLGNAGYVTANADFATSKIQWNHNGTLTVTLGGSATVSAVTTGLTAKYTPDASMMDLGGNYATGSASDKTTGSKDSNF